MVPARRLVSLSEADFDELRELGMSVTQAKRVMRYREERGGFSSLEELDRVPGFPRNFLDRSKTPGPVASAATSSALETAGIGSQAPRGHPTGADADRQQRQIAGSITLERVVVGVPLARVELTANRCSRQRQSIL